MERASTCLVLALFARTAIRRMVNGSSLLTSLFRRKAEGEESRRGTLRRDRRLSLGRRLLGGLFLCSVFFSIVMFGITSLATVAETVRLDELRSSQPIRLHAEDYLELAAAVGQPDPAARESALEAWRVRMAGQAVAAWTRPHYEQALQERCTAAGLAGFAAVDHSPYRGDLALLSPEGRGRALAGMALYLTIANLAAAMLGLGVMNRSLAGVDSSLNWLWQFPISRRVLFASRLVEYMCDTPTAFMNFVLSATIVALCGASFWTTVGLASAFALGATAACAAIRLAGEIALLTWSGRKLRGAVVSTACTLGNLLALYAMLGAGAEPGVRLLTEAADRLPACVFWTPFAPGLGLASLSPDAGSAWCGVSLAMSLLAALASVALAARLTNRGLPSSTSSGRTSPDAPVAPAKQAAPVELPALDAQPMEPAVSGSSLALRRLLPLADGGLGRREWLQLRRQPELLVQVLLSPLVILFILYLQKPDRLWSLAEHGPGAVCAAILTAACMLAMTAASQLLTREFQRLWLVQSLPRSLADCIRSKARWWSGVLLVPVAGMAGWGWLASSEPAEFAQRIPFLLGASWLLMQAIFAATSLGATVAGDSVRFRRVAFAAPALLAVEAGWAVYSGDLWMQLGSLTLLAFCGMAFRQKQIAELPWITEPEATPPRRLDALHGLLTLGGFLLLRNIVGGMLLQTDLPAATAVFLAFGTSAVIVFVVFGLWRRRAGVAMPRLAELQIAEASGLASTSTIWPAFGRFAHGRLASTAARAGRKLANLGPGAVTVGGMLAACATAVVWVSVLRQAGGHPASAYSNLHLPTSLSGIDFDVALRLIALLLVAPIFEEWLFRGLIFRSLRRSWGVWLSVGVSALLFTVIHPLESCVGVSVLAVATAIAYERTRRLLAPICMHFGYNLLVMALWTLG